jgi:hypothetical protein
MYFIKDEKQKVAFGWSPKSGCTHIKSIYCHLKNIKVKGLNTDEDPNEDNEIYDSVHNIKGFRGHLDRSNIDWTVLFFLRNPYERLVSGFMDKYGYKSQFRSMWKVDETLSFYNFTNKLFKKKWQFIERDHFEPQTAKFFSWNIVRQINKCLVFDIKKIDYLCIENLYGKKIPENIRNYKGGHVYTPVKKALDIDYIHSPLDLYNGCEIDYKNFYNTENIKKFKKFFNFDIIFSASKNIHFKI